MIDECVNKSTNDIKIFVGLFSPLVQRDVVNRSKMTIIQLKQLIFTLHSVRIYGQCHLSVHMHAYHEI